MPKGEEMETRQPLADLCSAHSSHEQLRYSLRRSGSDPRFPDDGESVHIVLDPSSWA